MNFEASDSDVLVPAVFYRGGIPFIVHHVENINSDFSLSLFPNKSCLFEINILGRGLKRVKLNQNQVPILNLLLAMGFNQNHEPWATSIVVWDLAFNCFAACYISKFFIPNESKGMRLSVSAYKSLSESISCI